MIDVTHDGDDRRTNLHVLLVVDLLDGRSGLDLGDELSLEAEFESDQLDGLLVETLVDRHELAHREALLDDLLGGQTHQLGKLVRRGVLGDAHEGLFGLAHRLGLLVFALALHAAHLAELLAGTRRTAVLHAADGALDILGDDLVVNLDLLFLLALLFLGGSSLFSGGLGFALGTRRLGDLLLGGLAIGGGGAHHILELALEFDGALAEALLAGLLFAIRFADDFDRAEHGQAADLLRRFVGLHRFGQGLHQRGESFGFGGHGDRLRLGDRLRFDDGRHFGDSGRFSDRLDRRANGGRWLFGNRFNGRHGGDRLLDDRFPLRRLGRDSRRGGRRFDGNGPRGFRRNLESEFRHVRGRGGRRRRGDAQALLELLLLFVRFPRLLFEPVEALLLFSPDLAGLIDQLLLLAEIAENHIAHLLANH